MYSDRLRPWLQRRGNETRLRQFLDAMQGTNVDILDLTSALTMAKKKGLRLYYRNDTHWNQIGALFGATAIVNHLSLGNAAVPAANPNDYSISHFVTKFKLDRSGLDLGTLALVAPPSEEDFQVEKKGGWTTVKTVRQQGSSSIYTYTKDAPQLPTVLVYTDSFGFDMQRVIAEYFRRAVFANWWPEKAHREETFPLKLIEEEQPELFVYIRMETGILASLAPFPAPDGGQAANRSQR